MQALWLTLFSITTGFTASGIVSNLYRLSGAKGEDDTGRILRMAVLAIAGPSVFFELAVGRLLSKELRPLVFWLIAGALIYWSMAIGLFVLDLAMLL